MIITKVRYRNRDLPNSLLPRLMERVFHVSLLSSLEKIKEDGEIKVSGTGLCPSVYPGHYNSFMRNRGYVSLFDYRSVPQEHLEDSLDKCSPTQGATPESGIVIFLFSRSDIPKLLSWREWNLEDAPREMVVPYVEAGHKGPISLKLIDEIICLEIDEEPNISNLL